MIGLINSWKPDAVLNVALPYQDLAIMDACVATGVHYIDTANYEAEDTEDPAWRAIYEARCRNLALRLTLIIPGSGHTRINSKKQESRGF